MDYESRMAAAVVEVGSPVRDYLKMSSALLADCKGEERPEGWRYRNIEEFVLRFGRTWTPAPLPPRTKRGLMKECFRNAFNLAERRPSLIYVEGHVSGIIPVHHAWCADQDGRVVDPTWPYRETDDYFGVPFTLDFVKSIIVDAKVWGVLYNWTAGKTGYNKYMTDDPDTFLDRRV